MTYPTSSYEPKYGSPAASTPQHAQPDPVDVRLEVAVSQLAHDFDLEWDEGAAARALLAGDNKAAIWHLQLQEQKDAALGRSGS